MDSLNVVMPSVSTFTYLVLAIMNADDDLRNMTSFGERVKTAWKNIYPIQDGDEVEKKKRK